MGEPTTLLAIYDKDDNLVQRFEYADQRMPISMIQNNQKYYLHYDQVGTLKAVSNSNQKIIKKIVYDTYGNIRKETNKGLKVPFGFAAGLYDTDTKLTRFGYRDYDAYTGKWTAKDPIDFGGGDSNLYGYVLQNPVSGIDASGLVDLNLIPTDDSLHDGAERVNSDTIFTIASHGCGGVLLPDVNNFMTAKEVADMINKFGKSEILFLACNQGDEQNTALSPQNIANLTGKKVQYTRV